MEAVWNKAPRHCRRCGHACGSGRVAVWPFRCRPRRERPSTSSAACTRGCRARSSSA